MNPRSHSQGWLPRSGLTVPLLHCWHSPLTSSLCALHTGVHTAAPASDEELPAHGRHAWVLPVLLLKLDGGHAVQFMLDVRKCPASQTHAVWFSFMAYPGSTHLQREAPGTVELLPEGQGRQVPESPTKGLYVEGEQVVHDLAATITCASCK